MSQLLLIYDDTLTNIANAIREKTGNTAQIFPENMPAQIRSITTSNMDTEGIPQGVVDEANRVSSSVNNKKASNSITFIAISDMHEMGDSDTTDSTLLEAYRAANLHAGQGIELVAKQIKPDFFANLGDLAWGIQSYTTHDMAQSITNARVKTGKIEQLTTCFATPGNHDIGYRAGNFDENLVKAMIGNYKYFDLDSKKIRVICANTSDISDGTDRTEGVSGEQLQWFANALDLSGKTDAANWGILIFSHHPLDWNANTMPLANCVAAYVKGKTYSVTHDSISISKAYSGKNAATIIGTFHGHVHCYKVANLSTTTEDNPVKRIAIPNACNGRNNEYGKDGNTTFGETAASTCPSGSSRKSTIAGEDTAFCAVTIDLNEKIIYADCFGSLGDTAPGSHAGYDRTISYKVIPAVVYTITNNLINATSSNGASTIVENNPYAASISPASGYLINSIQVTMGGIDITASAVTNNNISIANVTGNIVISVTTKINENPDSGSYTNLVLTALDPTDGVGIYDNVGFRDGGYLPPNTSGIDIPRAPGYTSTGGIYLPSGVSSIYIRGCTWDTTATTRMFFSSVDTPTGFLSYTMRGDDQGDKSLDYFFNIETFAEDYIKLTLNSNGIKYLYNRYYRITLKGSGVNLIITHDQPIPANAVSGNHSISYNLTNLASSNSILSITNGSAYNTTLTAHAGYTLDGATINVTMGGMDITSTVYNNGQITISSVTDNIVITGSAVKAATSYTNLIPTALNLTNPDNGAIFNANSTPGYMNGKYISTSSPYYNTDATTVTTGFIPYTKNIQKPIYIKGVTYATGSHDRMGYYDTNYSTGVRSTPKFSEAAFKNCFTVTQLGTNYFKFTPAAAATIESKFPRMKYIAFSFTGTGDNLIITVGEPIE